MEDLYALWKENQDSRIKRDLKMAIFDLEPSLVYDECFLFEYAIDLLGDYVDLGIFWSRLKETKVSVEAANLMLRLGLLRHEGRFPMRFLDKLCSVCMERGLNIYLYGQYVERD